MIEKWEASTPNEQQTYAGLMPDGIVIVPGDANGKLVIDTETFVEEYAQGIYSRWVSRGFGTEAAEKAAASAREQADVALPWLIKWTGIIPATYQRTDNILALLDKGAPLEVDTSVLAGHPDRNVRLFLAQNYPLTPSSLETILSFDDIGQEWADVLPSTQINLIRRRIQERSDGGTRRLLTLQSRWSRFIRDVSPN